MNMESKTKKPRKKSFKNIWWRGESLKVAPNNLKSNESLTRWHSEENMLCKPPSSVPYYYGHITRENAELILWDRGCLDGMYLLRASHSRDAEYVLSVGSNKQVLHYLIQKSADGLYHLNGASPETFAGPIELIENLHPTSLPFRLQIPCLKPVNVFMPGVNCGITEDRLQEALEKKAVEWGLKEDEMKSMIQNRDSDIWRLIFKTLHESESWFHGKITRGEAEKRLAKSGHKNGKFLIRERDECSFSLSLSYNNQVKHYKIDVLSSGEVGIPDGPRFDNIISLVSHYSVFSDGLWCCLKYSCINQATPIPTSTSTISWPIERIGASTMASPEPEPVFPLNNLNFNPNPVKRGSSILIPNVAAKNTETDTPKTPAVEVNSKKRRDSSTAVKPDERSPVPPKESDAPKKLTPVRPPPVPPSRKPPALLPSVNKNSPNDKSVKVPPVTKDLNDNDCSTGTAEKNPTSLTTSETSSNDESPKLVNRDIPKQNPLPFPRKKHVVLPLVLPPLESKPAKVLNTINQSPTPGVKSSPPTLLSKDDSNASKPALSPSNTEAISNSINGSKSPNLNVPKSSTPIDTPTPFSGLLAELKNHKVMNFKDQEQVGSPSSSGEQMRISDSKVSPNRESRAHSDRISKLEPAYVEIDGEYEAERERKLSLNVNTADSVSSESLLTLNVQESKWDELDETNTTKSYSRKPPWTKEESELHFNTIKRHRKGPATIDRRKLLVQERLGLGNFGEVFKASFQTESEEVPCALKTLRQDQLSCGKDEILREARIMTKMDHPHIVRLLGVSEGSPFLLVMELAPLGPLSGYLKRNPSFPNSEIVLLLYQVAQGMEYLESKQYVHRDLAARNVLLVNENFAKITDFGMSKALGLHSDYYTVEPQGRLPLKWYAPECIYYFKFSSKSDVWSYGITLWEAMGRGGKPYMGMTGREILQMFSNNTRLPSPENCPPEIYDVMKKCWALKPEDRPTFSQLVLMLKEQQKT